MKLFRPISSGYELKDDIAPEIKRNIPSEIKEKKSQKLNINAPSFIPKKSFANKKKNDNSDKTYNLNNKASYNPYFTNNSINQNYYNQPYYSTNPFQISQYQNQAKQTNKNPCFLKCTDSNFIPKSMRETNNRLNENEVT